MASQQVLHYIQFNNLKCLRSFTLPLDGNPVTGIFGPNGTGKSTILHALACVYKPSALGGENHKFSYFFKSDSNINWQGTNFEINYSQRNDINHRVETKSKIYKKASNRWIHDYAERPERPVFYIGINTCMPDIEVINSDLNLIHDVRSADALPKANEIKAAASVIMNMSYADLYQSEAHIISKPLMAVERGNAEHTKYQSLNMGAGEQRLLRILSVIHNAPRYSLILIDEIDLTLHTAALKRLISHISQYATDNHLQIVFTSHREELTKLETINVRHIYQERDRTLCLLNSTPECLEALTGTLTRPLELYVEDKLAKAIVEQILIEEKTLSLSNVYIFGSIRNAFTVATGLHIAGKLTDNVLIVTDGDEIRTEEERKHQIEQVYTGTEVDLPIRQQEALSHIKQFVLPEGVKPEPFIHNCLVNKDDGSEVVEAAKLIVAVPDTHLFVNDIITRLGVGEERGITQVLNKFSDCDEWAAYSAPIKDWVRARKIALAINT